MAGVFGEDFIEPAWVRLLVLSGNNLDNVALLKFGIEANHLAVHNGASTLRADFAM